MGDLVALLTGGGGSKTQRVTPPLEPADIDREGEKARDRERRERRNRQGRRSTIATSPLGLTDQARVGAKQLTGQ